MNYRPLLKLHTGIAIALFMFLFYAVIPAHAVQFESGIPIVGPGGARGADIPDLSTYISFLYTFVIGIVGIAGFVSLVVWGTVWVASGIVDKKAMALESIKNTFIGIGLALVAYIILNTISPRFTEISVPSLGKVESKQTTTSLYSGMLPDGSTCTKNDECLPGSSCEADGIDIETAVWTCTRSSAGAACTPFDGDPSGCALNTACKYCEMPGGALRCIKETVPYSKCTL